MGANKGTMGLSNPTSDVEFAIDGVSGGETWVINESPNVEDNIDMEIDFVSNNTQYIKIVINFSGIRYYQDSVDYVIAYQYDLLGGTGTWANIAYRTITFSTSPTFELLTWLQANAVKQ